MYGYIYLTVNQINHKIYIGQHIHKEFDKYYKGSGKLLNNAFNKYGKKNFSTYLLEECNSIEEMNDREAYYISKYMSDNRDIGYNIRSGGNNSPWSEEIKLKMSNSAKGRVFTEEHRKNIGLAQIGNTNNGRCNKDKHWVYNDSEQKLVTEEELPKYLEMGFTKGMRPYSKEKREFLKNKYSNGTYINNGIIDKYIDCSEIYKYINEGWKLGRVKYPKERGANVSAGKKGVIKIIRDSDNKIKYIQPNLLDEYIKLGFHRS